MVCQYEGCNNKDFYCIEWWGLNQHGKDPEIVNETYSCTNSEHLLAMCHPNQYDGTFPDEINIDETGEARPELLRIVKRLLGRKVTIENGNLLAKLIYQDVQSAKK